MSRPHFMPSCKRASLVSSFAIFLTQSGEHHMGTIAQVARFGLLGRTLLAGVPVAVATALTTPALARIESFPAGFRTQMVQTNGTRLHVRVGGKGPAVVLLPGLRHPAAQVAPAAKGPVPEHRAH